MIHLICKRPPRIDHREQGMFAGVGVDSHSYSYRWISWCHGDVDVMVVLALDSGFSFSFFKVLVRYGLALRCSTRVGVDARVTRRPTVQCYIYEP
jgi:hypothetical protein